MPEHLKYWERMTLGETEHNISADGTHDAGHCQACIVEQRQAETNEPPRVPTFTITADDPLFIETVKDYRNRLDNLPYDAALHDRLIEADRLIHEGVQWEKDGE